MYNFLLTTGLVKAGEQSPQHACLPPSSPQHISKLATLGGCNFP